MKTGRSKHEGRFVALPHSLIQSQAWKGLSAPAQAGWVHFAALYNGTNNGRIAMSSRRLGKLLNTSKDTGARVILELVNAGFVEKTASATTVGKRKAAEFRLTHKTCDRTGLLPSRAYQAQNRLTNIVAIRTACRG